jgi:hypothetical protein
MIFVQEVYCGQDARATRRRRETVAQASSPAIWVHKRDAPIRLAGKVTQILKSIGTQTDRDAK